MSLLIFGTMALLILIFFTIRYAVEQGVYRGIKKYVQLKSLEMEAEKYAYFDEKYGGGKKDGL